MGDMGGVGMQAAGNVIQQQLNPANQVDRAKSEAYLKGFKGKDLSPWEKAVTGYDPEAAAMRTQKMAYEQKKMEGIQKFSEQIAAGDKEGAMATLASIDPQLWLQTQKETQVLGVDDTEKQRILAIPEAQRTPGETKFLGTYIEPPKTDNLTGNAFGVKFLQDAKKKDGTPLYTTEDIISKLYPDKANNENYPADVKEWMLTHPGKIPTEKDLVDYKARVASATRAPSGVGGDVSERERFNYQKEKDQQAEQKGLTKEQQDKDEKRATAIEVTLGGKEAFNKDFSTGQASALQKSIDEYNALAAKIGRVPLTFQKNVNILKKNTWKLAPRTTPTQTAQVADRVSVIAPNGQTGTIPITQLNEALKNGYKQSK